jgi:FkbM family methyltransferase
LRISYAQNFEDVLLWRVFEDVQPGFYLDVGAFDPVLDSVSRSFFEAGWRGAHVEPVPAFAAALRANRADEIVFECAAGAAPGQATLTVRPGTGRSSLRHDAAVGGSGAAALQEYELVEVRVRTVTDMLDEAGKSPLWLKVDCEGTEHQVLAGWDRSRYRPWVAVIEAVDPVTLEPNAHLWEDDILTSGYRLVYDDRINRFYAAEERYDRVAPCFRFPVNVLDQFVPAALASLSAAWSAREAETGERLAALQDEITRITAVFEDLSRRYTEQEHVYRDGMAALERANVELRSALESVDRPPQLRRRWARR